MLAILSIASALSACAQSYGLNEGDASYDAIRRASDDCKAKGGVIQLKKGGDVTELSDYECKIGKGS
ncbi:MAG TPA: hypothetical protein VG939_20015 [Caulobacteraceae bacterium]|nr:hypothetical protein [Caulobacteraceae bacterium]